MATALEAGFDLGALLGCFVLIALLAIVGYTFERLAGALNVSILGVRPFASVAKAINRYIVDGCNDGIKALEKVAAHFEDGLIDAFGLILGLGMLLFLGVQTALVYLWDFAIRPLIRSFTDPIRTLASHAEAEAVGAAQGVATGLATLEHTINVRATAAEHTAAKYADGLIAGVEHDLSKGLNDLLGKLEGELARGIDDVRGTALSAVDKLRTAEDAAIDAAEAAISATGTELAELLGSLNPADAARLIASIPALAALVGLIALEAGLDTAACRGKVKNICTTDPTQWAALLGGLALMEGALSLRDLMPPARGIFGAFAGVVREAA